MRRVLAPISDLPYEHLRSDVFACALLDGSDLFKFLLGKKPWKRKVEKGCSAASKQIDEVLVIGFWRDRRNCAYRSSLVIVDLGGQNSTRCNCCQSPTDPSSLTDRLRWSCLCCYLLLTAMMSLWWCSSAFRSCEYPMTVSGHQCKSPPHIIHDQGGFWIFHSIAWRLAAKLVVHRGGDVFQLQSRLTFEANIPCPIQFLMRGIGQF
jgi:hypothetical protein